MDIFTQGGHVHGVFTWQNYISAYPLYNNVHLCKYIPAYLDLTPISSLQKYTVNL